MISTEESLGKTPFYHFSVDDVFDSLIEITDKKIEVFDHPFFSFLKELHDRFNINVDIYLFFQKKIDGKLRTLKDVSDSLKQTLNANTWIRFGPHALDYETAPYAQTPDEQIKIFDDIYKEISRFAGDGQMVKWIRLHYFSESYELKDYFHSKGIEALFTTDKERITTRMSDEINESLRENGFADYDGLKLIRSDVRTENLANEGIKGEELKFLIEKYINDYNHIIILTHECEIPREEVRFVTKELIKEIHNKKIPSF